MKPQDFVAPYYRDDSILLGIGMRPYELMLQLMAKRDDPFSGGRSYYCHPSLRRDNMPKIPHQSSATGMQAIPTTGIALGVQYKEIAGISEPGEAPVVVFGGSHPGPHLMAGGWLGERRTEVAADRILDAAERLFTEDDPASVGMNEIARAAGCSRATLYRYFDSREALRIAYVHRETHRLGREILPLVERIEDPRERLVASIAATLRMVRENPALAAWFGSTRSPIGGEMAGQSQVITALASGFLNSLGPAPVDAAALARRARWTVRVIISMLMFPGRDEDDERAMIEEFVVPVVAPVPADQGTQ